MANSLYWEDALSSSGGKQHDMPLSAHAPSFAVSWGTGKYDDVKPDHTNLVGVPRRPDGWGPCVACDWIGQRTPLGLCSYCNRAQNADEQSRIRRDAPMGSNKRSTHVITDTPR